MKKLILTTLLSSVVCGTVGAEMPTMNATDHVYGYHLRDVYKDMENMKYDDSEVRGDINDIYNKLSTANSRGDVLNDSVANITADIASVSDRINTMESDVNSSINTITNDMGVMKHDMENSKHSINNLESVTSEHANHIKRLDAGLSNLSNDVTTLRRDTSKGLAQANALSSLKYLGGKGLQISVGLGGYRGTSAIAYGLFYGVNDDLMLYAGGTDNSYNASVNIKIGGK